MNSPRDRDESTQMPPDILQLKALKSALISTPQQGKHSSSDFGHTNHSARIASLKGRQTIPHSQMP
jgi:hypothetical protein